jgi:CubicO group peptidase (beta-lactamase class C family)
MKFFSLVLAISSFFSILSALEIPYSPLNQRFSAWLDAFNSGERERLQESLQDFKNPIEQDIDQEWHFAQMTGGLVLKKIEKVNSKELIGVFQEKDSGQFVRLIFEIEPEFPYCITKLDGKKMSTPDEFKIERMSEFQAIETFKERLNELVNKRKFSGSVLIAKREKPIFSYSSGFANIEKQIFNRLDTKYNLGSMNKMFTAIAIAQLAQQGKIDFSDSLTKYIPDYPNPEFASVTIHQLLTHTGGTGDIFGSEYEAKIEKLKEPKDYMTLYADRSLEFEPGSQWRYSNYGFVLLGIIIERISGQSYYDYVQQYIFNPAGMFFSNSFWKTEEIENLAIGYTLERDVNLENNYYFLPMRESPAGGGYSNVEDLLRFANALLNNKLLNAEYTELLIKGKIDLQTEKYAYGFIDKSENGVRRFGHSGGAPGMNSTLRIYPVSGYVVIVMGNFDPPAAD